MHHLSVSSPARILWLFLFWIQHLHNQSKHQKPV
jgi:hypothetical protein